MDRLGIVLALKHEAAAIAPHINEYSTNTIISGMGSARAANAARRLVDSGTTALLSIGVSGGLDPSLTTAAIVVPRKLHRPNSPTLSADVRWLESLAGMVRAAPSFDPSRFTCDATITVDDIVDNPSQKAALLSATGAVAVDTESFAIAKVAAEAGVRFLSIRIIADTSDQVFPVQVFRPDGTGQVTVVTILSGLLKHPTSLGNVIETANQGRKALRALGRVAALAGPRFGL